MEGKDRHFNSWKWLMKWHCTVLSETAVLTVWCCSWSGSFLQYSMATVNNARFSASHCLDSLTDLFLCSQIVKSISFRCKKMPKQAISRRLAQRIRDKCICRMWIGSCDCTHLTSKHFLIQPDSTRVCFFILIPILYRIASFGTSTCTHLLHYWQLTGSRLTVAGTKKISETFPKKLFRISKPSFLFFPFLFSLQTTTFTNTIEQSIPLDIH